MRYKDFFPLNESMTTSVRGADYSKQDLDNMLGLSFALKNKVVTSVVNALGEFDKENFYQNRNMEIIVPDGENTFDPIGTMNFYTSGFNEAGVQAVIDGVKKYLPMIGAAVGSVRGPEKSGMYKSPVVRFEITKNDNAERGGEVPEVNMSNANARIIYRDVLGLDDFEEGYSIKAIDLYNRIKAVLDNDKNDLDKVQRLPSMDAGNGGAMMYTGALRSDDIVERLHRIAEVCLYAMKHGHAEISIG
jgi:hypothetical protein